MFDPFDGKKDLEKGRIVFVGNSEKRINEDYLRILRYIRFFSNYSKIDHDPDVQKIIKKKIVGINNLSSERLLDEFNKIFKSNLLEKLCENDFSLEITKLIFPQFKNFEIIKNLNKFSKENLRSIDFCLLLCLLIIDDTDNAEYFAYKFNISKKYQKRINIIKKFYYGKKEVLKFNTENLWKVFYKYGKESFNDILNFKFFISKKNDKKIFNYINFFIDKTVPILPIKGDDLIKKYGIPEGEKIGKILEAVENYWINNNFKITDEEIEKIIKN